MTHGIGCEALLHGGRGEVGDMLVTWSVEMSLQSLNPVGGQELSTSNWCIGHEEQMH